MIKSTFPDRELATLKRWRDKDIFKKTLAKTAQSKRFVFYEGPPTANGRPHIGHVQGRAFKDVICRYKTMRGYFVERKAGWDTQGLPVELEVEKQLKVSGKRDIEKFGVGKFNQACRDSVWKYQAEWEKMTERIGYWLDMEHPYITYDKSYIESLWWIFKQIWEKKLLVKDYKVVPQCPRCETALSSHEVAQGYEKVTENSVYVKFKVKSDKGKVKKGDYILSWTTTPWTLPGNVALAVNPDIKYVITPLSNGERYIVAQKLINLVDDYVGQELKGDTKSISTQIINGADLVGLKYEPLFHGAIPKDVKGFENAFKVYAADFVTTDEGTGVVHTAVMYGEDDYRLGTEVGLPKHHTVTPDGHFTKDVKEFAGQFVKDEKTQQGIIDFLKSNGLLYKEEPYEHDYPFCWRCHSPLLYYAKDSWFITMSKLREKLIKNNEQINWVPGYIKHGRFGEWLNEIKDWAVSRERYWGTPIPVWECTQCGERECVGSYEELADRSGDNGVLTEAFDPHRPFIDRITWPCRCGGTMTRIPEVADAWFDSGSMPYAQWHYPFENKERIDRGISFPADYISEAIDQTRGWFYTLLAVATALGKAAPYRQVICQAHVMDAQGKKMSKHIGNVVDPRRAIDEFGADTVRWFFLTASQPGEAKNYDPKNLTEIVRKNFMVLSNVLSFFQLYAGANSVTEKTPHILDQWIMDLTYHLVAETTEHLDNYRITEAGRGLTKFIDDLSTWYVRRSRERFKDPAQRDQAVDTLRHVLLTLAKLLAPFAPFFADDLYRATGGELDSVHLADWPKAVHAPSAEVLEQMAAVRTAAEAVHSLRSDLGVKVRQPLSELVITGTKLRPEYIDVMRDEANVMAVRLAAELPKGKEWRVKTLGNIGLAVNAVITPELAALGLVRELVRQTNSLRKQAGLTIHDRVDLYINAEPAPFMEALKPYERKISDDTLSRSVRFGELPAEDAVASEFKTDGGIVRISIVK